MCGAKDQAVECTEQCSSGTSAAAPKGDGNRGHGQINMSGKPTPKPKAWPLKSGNIHAGVAMVAYTCGCGSAT